MVYESQITFTLDTICPWTYIALLRLRRALALYATTHPTPAAHFTLTYAPFQLHPTLPAAGTDKHAWYTSTIHHGSASQMSAYEAVVAAAGAEEGIAFGFTGVVGNTLPALRAVVWAQGRFGAELAGRVVDGLCSRYFEGGASPGSEGTVGGALVDAGVEVGVVEAFLADGDEGLADVKMAVQEQRGNGVDAVPYVVVEGRKRDFTLQGAKSVEEYGKVLEMVGKESS